MISRARWILISTAMMLVAGAVWWSCGGGGSSAPCVTGTNGIPVGPCGVPTAIGPSLEKIEICNGASPLTPVPTTITVSPTPTPELTPCPAPTTTMVPQGCTIQFHAIGTFSDGSTQDITDYASTSWASSDPSVVSLNAPPPSQFNTTAEGTAVVNASSGTIKGVGIPVSVGAPGACPTTVPADEFGDQPAEAPPDWSEAPQQ
jgi:hypothetical protein